MANDRSAYLAISTIPGNTGIVIVAQLPTQPAKKPCLISRYFITLCQMHVRRSASAPDFFPSHVFLIQSHSYYYFCLCNCPLRLGLLSISGSGPALVHPGFCACCGHQNSRVERILLSMGLEGKMPDSLNMVQIGPKVHFFSTRFLTAIRQTTHNTLYSGIRDEPVDKRNFGQGLPQSFFFLSSRNRYQGLTGPDPAKPAETRDPPTKYWPYLVSRLMGEWGEPSSRRIA